MPPKQLPLPPQPDPLTLDQIYDNIVSPECTETRAYHIVALNSVAFHPTVKLSLYEHAAPTPGEPLLPLVAAQNNMRREALLKQIAFFLCVRNSPVSRECRWETISLIGELCRMEQASSPPGAFDQKLNDYAKMNLELLASLPWFSQTLREIMGDGEKATKSSSRDNGRGEEDEGDTWEESDEDVKVAMSDVLKALPEVRAVNNEAVFDWTEDNWSQAHDLMFLDASTSLASLIPMVSRCSNVICAKCMKKWQKSSDESSGAFLRCSACKAVFYCGIDCQRAHWSTTHRVPCLAYKETCAAVLAKYHAMYSKQQKRRKKAADETPFLDVPLEPSLFFETRRYLYDHRDKSFDGVSFSDYFLKYSVRGS